MHARHHVAYICQPAVASSSKEDHDDSLSDAFFLASWQAPEMRKPTSSELSRAENVDQLMERGKGGVGEDRKHGPILS